MLVLGAKTRIWVLAFQGMSRYSLSQKIMLKGGSCDLSFCPKAVRAKFRNTILALKISQLCEGPAGIITSQESGRQSTHRLTPRAVKWVWIP